MLARYIGKLLLSLHFAIEEGAIFENKIFIRFFMILRQMAVKILVYTVKARLCYSCFEAKMSKSHNENDRPDNKPLQQISQYMNTVLQNMNDN